jgi:hypothetical protein
MMAPALFFVGNEKKYGGPAAKNFGPLECLPPLRMELANFLGRKKCHKFPRKTVFPVWCSFANFTDHPPNPPRC